MLIRPGFNQGFGFPLSGRPNSPPIADTGGGGGGAYVAKAVHVDGNVLLINNALNATDNEFFAASVWYRDVSGSPTGILMVSDPDNAYANVLDTTGTRGVLTGSQISWDLGNSDNSRTLKGEFITSGPALGSWHHFLIATNTNFDAGLKQVAMYFDDVLIDKALVVKSGDDPSPAFTMAFNSLKMCLFDDGFDDGTVGDYADLWLAPGSNLLDENGEIPEVTRRLFISSSLKPVNPTGFPSAPVLMSGDADSFATNLGTGGAFVSSGLSPLTDATTSPSD